MYSMFCALGIFFVIFVVPETKGRDLESIQKLFANKDSNEIIKEKSTVNLASIESAMIENERNSSPYEITRL